MNQNGKVIVTGCMGANAQDITSVHPGVLVVSGPHACEEVMQAVCNHLPPPQDRRVRPQRARLTPRHYAYLKISEGCNYRCSFCVIPTMRGALVSRPIAEVMDEAVRLIETGVRELLVISQDTSAYGADLKYRTDIWNDRPLKTCFTELTGVLGELDAWTRRTPIHMLMRSFR